MEAILATGLVTLGRELFQQITKPDPAPQALNFEKLLAEQSHNRSACSQSCPATAQQLHQVRQALANSPEAHELASNGTGGLWLTQLPDGGFSLSTDTGAPVRIASDSPTSSLARQVFDLSQSSPMSHKSGLGATDRVWIAPGA